MVSSAMGAAMVGTMFFLRANCAQHGGGASGGGLISASLLCKLHDSSSDYVTKFTTRGRKYFLRISIDFYQRLLNVFILNYSKTNLTVTGKLTSM